MNPSTMLCLVKCPNHVVLEVECDNKAKGQECLDKVCLMLGIIEVDYFGLQYCGQRGEMLWINMRNQIKQQMTGANTPPFRFQLKVKFFVPPHLLLQEVTRHQFFISIVQDLQEGRLRVNNLQLAIKLVALIAQSEIGDLSSEVVTSALLSYRKWIPLSILENEMSNEMSCSSPTLQRKGKRRKHHSGSSGPDLSSENEDSLSDIDYNNSQTISSLNQMVISSDFSSLTNSIIQSHQKLEGTKPTHAQYLFLQEVSNLEDIGVEYFPVKLNTSYEDPYKIGVGPKGVTVICEQTNEVKHSIQYSCIHMATHSGRCFFLTHIEPTGDSQALGFKLESALTANAIYRAVTEKHAFYSCETVRNTVTTQFIRDLKGTIFSLFNENTTLGKNYVFDIRRTCREVYDHTRRELYQLEAIAKSDDSSQTENKKEMIDLCLDLEHSATHSSLCKKSECKDMKNRLEALQDSILCRICFDAEVCTAFNCGHVVCCESCAPQCDRCPLCRCLVSSVQKIYLPLSRTGLQQTLSCDTKC